MNISPDDKDRLWQDHPKTSGFRLSNLLRYGTFIILLIGLLTGLWYLISPSSQFYNKADLPLIRADQTPYKIKPENQDIPSVKHQDKLVYGRIRADQNDPVVEHILPDPEAPLPEIKDNHTPVKMVEQYLPNDGDPEKGIESLEDEPVKDIPSFTSIEDLIDEIPEEDEKPTGGIGKNQTFIQLGSFKSYDMAELEWKRLLKKYPKDLSQLEPIIQKVDLGEERGIYYRLRTGPFDNIEKANEVCMNLQAQKEECSLVP
jgi:hypothetical protein